MSGRSRPKSTEETPGKTRGATGPGSTRRKPSGKGEEKRDGSSKAAAPPMDRDKDRDRAGGRGGRTATVPRGAPSPTPAKTPLNSKPPPAAAPRTAARGAEDKNTPRNPPSSTTSIDYNPDRVLRDTLEKLKIKKTERNEATRCVNEIQKEIAKHLKESLDWCKEIQELKTGSHVENVKICESDEFDVMLVISVDRVDIQPFRGDGAFYSVALKRNSCKSLDKFLNKDKIIEASKMLTEFRKKVKECVPKLTSKYNITVEGKKPGCPAVTLQVKGKDGRIISLDFVLGLEVHSSSWPAITKDGFKIDNWLGRKVKTDLKRKPFYLVPKYEGKGTTECDGVKAKDAWRISFSHVEKEVLKNHGHSKTCCEGRPSCCRKQCLKLLKYLVQGLKEHHPKEAGKLCSYHAKTTLLHACAERVEDSEWEISQLSHCFQQVLSDFENYLRKQDLPNFFIPSHNLLKSAGLDKKTCNFLADEIEFQRNNCFPVFR
ncbi:cyclic GMP-AMP synthase [Astyanax mexicanus]|uniref:cyclic GMP-AMP synthase n=1 Tax=Astyanax mexicanus TaxID=7994 RepID=UPI0020CB0325|nr:cyclic GMP-AMP synthase [Astyanax mexicanus]